MKAKSTLKEYLWSLAISIVGSTVAIYFMCTVCRSDGDLYLWNVVLSSIAWFSLWTINNVLNHSLDKKISWIRTPVKRLVIGVLATIFFTVCGIVLILRAWELIWSVSFHNYSDVIVNALMITFFISLFFHGRSFLYQWRQSAVEAERFQKESMQATYESLKSQVNPHFLFNSLNALTNLVYDDQDKAVNFIKQLADVYRYVLDTRDKEVVSLEEELRFLKSYAYLQEIRFGDKLSIEISLNGLKSMVAPLALQMLIENAVKHNEVSEENPLRIKIYSEANLIVVENNLQKKSRLGESSSGLGLENITKRYGFLSNEKVVIEQSADTFFVKLPIIPAP